MVSLGTDVGDEIINTSGTAPGWKGEELRTKSFIGTFKNIWIL